MIVLFVNKQRKFDTDEVDRLKSICQRAMDAVESRPFLDNALRNKSTCLSTTISFVGADHMRKTNYQYRDIRSLTDVLSFPLLDMHNGKMVTPLGAQDILWHKDGVGEIALGDVLISLDRANEQAQQIGHDLEREVAFLTIHAGLHLLGFDHVNEDDEKKMIAEQKRIINDLFPEKKKEWPGASGPRTETAENLAHSGFVAIIGKPNVGKSTLINQLSGMKLAIISAKPQTTRSNIRAIINRDDTQIVFVDTPGVHKPQNDLSRYMVDSSVRAAQYADVIVLMVDGRFSRPGEKDRAIIERISRFKKPIILAVNKIDDVVKESLLPIIQSYSDLHAFDTIIPVSAKTGDGVEELLDEVTKRLPSGPRYYPESDYTDQSERSISAELIREQILHYTNQEVPHGTAVLIDKFEEIHSEDAKDEFDRKMIRIYASIICERSTHKSIILGKDGQMIKRIGTSARRNIESMTGCKVYLELHVKVRSDWKNASSHLNELGYKIGDISGQP
ncbi:MAG: GTPase Era [Clostridiales bacterium]|nr:GTPase Era [Clostridiales bacterium]